MVGKLTLPVWLVGKWFESSVNSYGRKTYKGVTKGVTQFESSVNSYGRKT